MTAKHGDRARVSFAPMGNGALKAPRLRAGFGAIAIAVFAALWLGTTAPSARAAEPFSHGCPKKILEEGVAEQVNRNPRARHALVPSGAVSVRICRYYGYGAGRQTPKTQARFGELQDQVELHGVDLLESLSLEFAELEPVGNGSYSCPFDEGARLFAVFAYAGDKPVIVEVNLSGCQFAYNGHGNARFMDESLRSKLERLLEGHGAQPRSTSKFTRRWPSPTRRRT